jgi:hypothetical protein
MYSWIIIEIITVIYIANTSYIQGGFLQRYMLGTYSHKNNEHTQNEATKNQRIRRFLSFFVVFRCFHNLK